MADVAITVDDVTISYRVEFCPVTAWLDPETPDSITFGIYPEYLTASDGSRWSTHMVVLEMLNGTPADWSFILTTPLSGKPGDAERRLISGADADSGIAASMTDVEASFTTGFWDSENSDIVPRPIPGTVMVTCR